ncbi:hypothetical protein Tco_0894413, partial [Tanacetum coccineum]
HDFSELSAGHVGEPDELSKACDGCCQNMNNSTLRSIFTSEKHTEPNFTNSHRNLRIALRYEKKLLHLEQPLQPALDPATAILEVVDAYYDMVNAQQEVACLMLASMSPDL